MMKVIESDSGHVEVHFERSMPRAHEDRYTDYELRPPLGVTIKQEEAEEVIRKIEPFYPKDDHRWQVAYMEFLVQNEGGIWNGRVVRPFND